MRTGGSDLKNLSVRKRLSILGIAQVNPGNLILYGLTVALIIGLKMAWRNVRPTEPWIFMAPLISALQFLTGTHFIHQPDCFYNPALSIVVTKDCGGMNYFLIAHGLLIFSYIHRFRGTARFWAYLAIFLGSFGLTLLANVSRVMISILLGRSGIMPAALMGTPHLALGAFVYFFFLIACNGLTGVIVRKYCRIEEGVD